MAGSPGMLFADLPASRPHRSSPSRGRVPESGSPLAFPDRNSFRSAVMLSALVGRAWHEHVPKRPSRVRGQPPERADGNRGGQVDEAALQEIKGECEATKGGVGQGDVSPWLSNASTYSASVPAASQASARGTWPRIQSSP
jgi:hypothetical protein